MLKTTDSVGPAHASPYRTSFMHAFSKSQIAAGTATAVDYAVLFSLVEWAGVWYVVATAIGALAGALTNFVMNRQWSFRATHRHWSGQAVKYFLVSAGSMALNTGGVWAVTEGLKVHYAVSVILVSLLVGVGFNFPLHRYYVFK